MDNPIVFLDVVVHYGGSKRLTVNLAKQIQHKCPAVVIDAYGNCDEYMSALSKAGVNTKVVIPHTRKGVIGGSSSISRSLKIAAAIPEFIVLIRRLSKMFALVKPSVVVVSCEKAFFLATHSLSGRVPVVYYLMGESFGHPWYNKRSWQEMDLVIGLSQSCLDSLDNCRYKPRHTAIVYNGIDIEAVIDLSRQPVEDLPDTNKALKVLLPATIVPVKAQDVAVKAMAMCRDAGIDVQLWLSSCRPRGAENSYAANLLTLISELKLDDRVSFIGWRDNIYSVMAASDVVLLTSKTEGMPYCLMEAMALQKPVIATKVGGIPEFIRDGVDGLLVDKGDVKGICDALKKLSDADFRSQMGKSGSMRIRQQFTLDRQAEEFLKCIYYVTSRKE